MRHRLLRPITLVGIVTILALTTAVPLTASAMALPDPPEVVDLAPSPSTLHNTTPTIDMATPECPFCWFVAGAIVSIVVAMIDNPDGPIATAVYDSIAYVAENLEGCTIAASGCR